MVALIFGIILIGFCVFACLPCSPLAWGAEVIQFLKGAAPVFAALFGIVAVFIGIADLKDKREAKREEKLSQDNKEKK